MDSMSGGDTRCDRAGHKGGRSSFWMHDPEAVFDRLQLARGESFLDVGCGPGDYSLYASRTVGEGGQVYALDKSAELVSELGRKADLQGLGNIKAMAADITAGLPIADGSIDACLLATVLHIPDVIKGWRLLFAELRRVLKPAGRVAVMECKKEKMPFGPPMHMRLSPEEVEALLNQCGFRKTDAVDLGYNYMVLFKAA